eukprot:1152222-Rhodomonas_salina.1
MHDDMMTPCGVERVVRHGNARRVVLVEHSGCLLLIAEAMQRRTQSSASHRTDAGPSRQWAVVEPADVAGDGLASVRIHNKVGVHWHPAPPVQVGLARAGVAVGDALCGRAAQILQHVLCLPKMFDSQALAESLQSPGSYRTDRYSVSHAANVQHVLEVPLLTDGDGASLPVSNDLATKVFLCLAVISAVKGHQEILLKELKDIKGLVQSKSSMWVETIRSEQYLPPA